MEFSEILQLMREFSKLPVYRMSLETDNLELTLEKQGGEGAAVRAVCPPDAAADKPGAGAGGTGVIGKRERDCGALSGGRCILRGAVPGPTLRVNRLPC